MPPAMTAYLEDGGFALRLEPADIAENIELAQASSSVRPTSLSTRYLNELLGRMLCNSLVRINHLC